MKAKVGVTENKRHIIFIQKGYVHLSENWHNYKGKTHRKSSKEEIQSDSQEVTFITECLSAAKPSSMSAEDDRNLVLKSVSSLRVWNLSITISVIKIMTEGSTRMWQKSLEMSGMVSWKMTDFQEKGMNLEKGEKGIPRKRDSPENTNNLTCLRKSHSFHCC